MQNLVAGFDPTGQTDITAADLKALIEQCRVFEDIGLWKVTDDVAGVPQVPDAVANPDLQRYGWIRRTATGAVGYLWNPNAISDATYLKWQTFSVSAIADGSITTAKYQDNSVTDAKIANVDPSKITGVLSMAQLPTSLSLIRSHAFLLSGLVSIDASGTPAYQIPADNTIPQITAGKQIIATTSFVPNANTAAMRIRFNCVVWAAGLNVKPTAAIFQNTTADAICSTHGYANSNAIQALVLDHWVASPGAVATTFSIRIGPSAGVVLYVNSDSAGSSIHGASMKSWMTVDEYVTADLN